MSVAPNHDNTMKDGDLGRRAPRGTKLSCVLDGKGCRAESSGQRLRGRGSVAAPGRPLLRPGPLSPRPQLRGQRSGRPRPEKRSRMRSRILRSCAWRSQGRPGRSASVRGKRSCEPCSRASAPGPSLVRMPRFPRPPRKAVLKFWPLRPMTRPGGRTEKRQGAEYAQAPDSRAFHVPGGLGA